MLIIPLAFLAASASAPPSSPSSDDIAIGTISREEAVRRADRLFNLLDPDGTPLLTRAEVEENGAKLMAKRLLTGVDVAPGIGGHTLRFYKKALASKPSVTRAQFEQVMLDHFDQMDTNHDGLLTPEERAAGRLAAEQER